MSSKPPHRPMLACGAPAMMGGDVGSTDRRAQRPREPVAASALPHTPIPPTGLAAACQPSRRPVGAYTHLQGLEWAVESRLVRNEAEAAAWIGDQLNGVWHASMPPLVASSRRGRETKTPSLRGSMTTFRQPRDCRRDACRDGADGLVAGEAAGRAGCALRRFPAGAHACWRSRPRLSTAWSAAAAGLAVGPARRSSPTCGPGWRTR